MKSFYINGTVITMEDDALYADMQKQYVQKTGRFLQLVIRMRL